MTNANLAALLGVLVLAPTTIMWFRLASRVLLPENRLFFLILWSLAGVLGLGSFFSPGAGWLSGILGGFAALGAVAMLLVYRLGLQGTGAAIVVGERIPEFTAVDVAGQNFSSAQLAGAPLLIKFFRGHW